MILKQSVLFALKIYIQLLCGEGLGKIRPEHRRQVRKFPGRLKRRDSLSEGSTWGQVVGMEKSGLT